MSAYQNNKYASQAILRLEENMNAAMTPAKYGIAIMTDLEGAFDSVWRERAIYKLYKAGITNNLLLVLENFLKHSKYKKFTVQTLTQEVGQTQFMEYHKGRYLAL